MSLTKAQMDALDEQVMIRSFPAVMSFTPVSAEYKTPGDVRTRSLLPRWAIQAAARRQQLDQMARELEREEQL
jgi:hypothetical protein